MCKKLLNVNMKKCSNAELIALRGQTLSAFNLHMQATQELIRRCNNNNDQATKPEEMHNPQEVVISNGHNLPPINLSDINEDDFDIFLDMTANSLRYRKDPVKHSSMKEADLKGIGPRRIEILNYLLEHPTRNISVENVSALPGQMEYVSPNTLSKTISLLRKTLGQKGAKGPYIITDPSLGSVQHIYKLNLQWRYLVIRKFEKSQGSQRHGNRKVRHPL